MPDNIPSDHELAIIAARLWNCEDSTADPQFEALKQVRDRAYRAGQESVSVQRDTKDLIASKAGEFINAAGYIGELSEESGKAWACHVHRAGQIDALRRCLALVQDYPEEFAAIDAEIIKMEAENAR